MAEANIDRAVVDPQIVDSVASSNLKTLGDAGAQYASLAVGNAVSHQNRLNVLAETSVATAIKRLQEVDVEEAVSISKVMSSNVQDELTQLGAVIGQLQQIIKASQTTPPVTP